MRILFVAPQPDSGAWLYRALQESGHSLRETQSFRDGVFLAGDEPFDAILLIAADRQQLSMLHPALPCFARFAGHGGVIVVSAANTRAAERAALLRDGADVCLSMPVSITELQVRLDAVRRCAAGPAQSGIPPDPGNIARILSAGKVLSRETGTVPPKTTLSRREALLLECLMRRPNQPVAREEIIRYAWPEDVSDVDPSAINLAMSRLRRKLSESGIHIEAVSRYGYRLNMS
jgi:two-component system, OmpR family, response regulator